MDSLWGEIRYLAVIALILVVAHVSLPMEMFLALNGLLFRHFLLKEKSFFGLFIGWSTGGNGGAHGTNGTRLPSEASMKTVPSGAFAYFMGAAEVEEVDILSK